MEYFHVRVAPHTQRISRPRATASHPVSATGHGFKGQRTTISSEAETALAPTTACIHLGSRLGGNGKLRHFEGGTELV